MIKQIWAGLIWLMLVALPLVPLPGAQKEAQDKADKKQPAAKEVPGKDFQRLGIARRYGPVRLARHGFPVRQRKSALSGYGRGVPVAMTGFRTARQ
jgi:hypothetical protein